MITHTILSVRKLPYYVSSQVGNEKNADVKIGKGMIMSEDNGREHSHGELKRRRVSISELEMKGIRSYVSENSLTIKHFLEVFQKSYKQCPLIFIFFLIY